MYGIQKYISKYLIDRHKLRLEIFKKLQESQFQSLIELKRKQLLRLNEILNHAYQSVPYYADLLGNTGLVRKNEIELLDISELNQIPILTKDDIRSAGQNLYSRDHADRKSFLNTSGGSTGVPVYFLQDKYYSQATEANFMLVKKWRGVEYYDSVTQLWGAARDTYKGKKPLDMYLRDFARNRILLNTAKMDDRIMRKYIAILNRHKPHLIIAYVQSIYELAKFSSQNDIHIEKQNSIHTSAGTLYDYMRDDIENVFQSKVFNHYGSREVGHIASECKEHDGLHIMMDNVIVEILDPNGNPCPPGEEGEIIITTLNNFSMPLIRYRIEDIGILKEEGQCNCGVNYAMIKKVTGRSGDGLITEKNERISAEYLSLTFNFLDGVKQFQIIQKDYDHVLIKIVKDENFSEQLISKITEKMNLLMGPDCKIRFEFPTTIPTTPTGKYRYTICEIK